VIATLVILTLVNQEETTELGEAPGFSLTTTAGEEVSLESSLAEGDTLLYFSMGLGCDGCFAQIPALEEALADRDIKMLSIMVDPAEPVAMEEKRFGVTDPILIDSDGEVSTAYDMVGVYGHNDRPSHSFALVNRSGNIKWVRHYAEMFVPPEALMAELEAAVAG
jgi:peroxiredoxin